MHYLRFEPRNIVRMNRKNSITFEVCSMLILTVRVSLRVRIDKNKIKPMMNGLKTEAIARVRRQTRHTEFNNQSVICKSKKAKETCQYQSKIYNNNLFFFFFFVLVILSKLKIIQINK